MRWRVLRAGIGLPVVLFAVAGAAPQAVVASGTPDLIDVVQVGTGAGTLSSAATAAFVVPMLSSGTIGAPIVLPTADSGSQHAITESGSATSDGNLELSGNGDYLTLGGYDATPGTTGPGGGSINGTTSATNPRVIARIDGAGDVDTSTALSDAFSTSNFRGVVSDDGTHFWAAGDGGSVTSGSDKNAGLVYVGSLGASTSTGLTTAPKQARDVVIAGGNVYFSTSKSPGPGVFELGSGLPTTSGQPTSAIENQTTSDPYGIVLLHLGSDTSPVDTAYIADGTSGGIYKYCLEGSTWVAKGSVGGAALGALTGRVENGGVQLYASTNAGDKVVALTDTSGFDNPITGSFTTIATAPANTVYRGVAFAPSGQVPPTPAPTVALSDTSLSATLGDSFEPTLTAAPDDQGIVDASQLTVTATSSNQSVVADAGIAISGNGTSGPRTLTLTPAGAVGYATITVTASTPNGGPSGSSTFLYGVSAAAPDAASTYLYGSGSDASTAVDVGDGYFIVGDDEYDTLAMYKSGSSGEPVATWNFTSDMGNPGEIDIESSARLGNTIYWLGSMGNSTKGNVEPDRDLLFATAVTGSGAGTGLSFAGYYTNLRNDLIDWDEANGNQFGFAAGAAQGQIAKEIDGFNVEGLEFAPGASTTTAYLGFRAPIVPPGDPQDALVVPVTNFTSLVTASGGPATFGTPLEWNLTPQGYVNGNEGDPSELGIREIRKNADGQYVIIAGSYEGVPAAPSGGSQFLYTWDGNPADQPVLTSTVLPTPDGGSWESVITVPDPLVDGSPIPMIEDDGDANPYGDPAGTELKDLAFGLQKDHADVFDLALPSQTITFTSTAPSSTDIGTTYTPAASASSGLPVTFGIDARSAPSGVCSLSAGVVTFAKVGTCVVDADQSGDFQYAAAPEVSQTIPVVDVPVLHLPGHVIAEATKREGANVRYDATATDPLGGRVRLRCEPRSRSTFPIGDTTVRCTATNKAGHTTTGSFVVTVQDTKPPVLHLPEDKVAEATGPGGRPVSFDATARDLVDGPVPVTCDPVSGSAFPIGTTTVDCTATDAHGNTASGSFTITVQDTKPPVLHLPDRVNAKTKGAASVTVDFTATATDVVDGSVPVTCTPPSGSSFPIGETIVHCSATDAHGNSASGSFPVDVTSR